MPVDALSQTFSALADPTRRAILARLAAGEATVTELAAPFEMSLPAVTKHLKVLSRAGLITQGRQAQWRPCRLEAAPLAEVSGWVEQYRQFWEQRLDRLEAYLRDLQATQARPVPPPARAARKLPGGTKPGSGAASTAASNATAATAAKTRTTAPAKPARARKR